MHPGEMGKGAWNPGSRNHIVWKSLVPVLAHVTEQQGLSLSLQLFFLIFKSEAILASIFKYLLGVRNVIKPVSNSNLSIALQER